MRMERLELSRMSSPDSKSGASTNYATSALYLSISITSYNIVTRTKICQYTINIDKNK
jgi:hypothetical protein